MHHKRCSQGQRKYLFERVFFATVLLSAMSMTHAYHVLEYGPNVLRKAAALAKAVDSCESCKSLCRKQGSKVASCTPLSNEYKSGTNSGYTCTCD